jgi:very-short-patch-repair endonuclease
MMFFERARLPLKLCKMIDLRDAPDALLLVPQFAWSYYRSDWAILNPKRAGALLIECDGKDFHSSAEQRRHDYQKDANAHDRGYLTMRFTGSQIHKDADGCAQKIFDAVCGL